MQRKASTELFAIVDTDDTILPISTLANHPRLGLFNLRNSELHWTPLVSGAPKPPLLHMKSPCAEVLDMALSKMDPKKKQGYFDQLKKSTTCSAPVPAPVAIRTTEVAKVEQEILLHKLGSCSKIGKPMRCVIAAYGILLPLVVGAISKRIPSYPVIPWFNSSYFGSYFGTSGHSPPKFATLATVATPVVGGYC